MKTLRARVRNGRLVLDEPTSLPEGTVVPLVAADEDDDLTDAERAALDAALEKAWAEVRAGKGRPAKSVLRELRRR